MWKIQKSLSFIELIQHFFLLKTENHENHNQARSVYTWTNWIISNSQKLINKQMTTFNYTLHIIFKQIRVLIDCSPLEPPHITKIKNLISSISYSVHFYMCATPSRYSRALTATFKFKRFSMWVWYQQLFAFIFSVSREDILKWA